jgi:hypothetical protein
MTKPPVPLAMADGANGAKSGTGKSYVIFGKKDSTTIDLSAIASGTGGFVINGENANDWSGVSALAIVDRLIAVLSVLPKTT